MDLTTQKQILTNLKDIIEVAQGRGCWKAIEMKPVGETYTNFCKLIKEVDEKLHNIMLNIHQQCVDYGRESDGYIDYVKGANIAGFVKVADAMIDQGLV